MTLVENLSTLARHCDWRNSPACIDFRADCGCREAIFLFALREMYARRFCPADAQLHTLQAALGVISLHPPLWMDREWGNPCAAG